MIPSRANTPEQKAEVLRRIAEHWNRNPDLRLMQMITWAVREHRGTVDCFNVEDFDLLGFLDKSFPERTLNQDSNGTENHSTNS